MAKKIDVEGLSMYLHRPLCRVYAGVDEDRKTGYLLGGHDIKWGDNFAKCISPCCQGLPLTLAEGSTERVENKLEWTRTGGGCIMTCCTFEKHAGCKHKNWRKSMHASAEPPPGAAGLAAAGSTAQLGAQHEQPDDLALAVAAQVSANDRIIAHWLDLCGRELERQYALAANKVDIWVWWPLDKAWYSGKVESFCEVTCQHTILYADGDLEELVLVLERFSLQLPPGRVASCDQSQLQPQRQQQRRRRRRRQSRPAAQESDEESDDSDDEEAWQQQQQQQQQDQQQQRQQRELRLQQRQQQLQLQQWQQQQEQEPPQQQQQEQEPPQQQQQEQQHQEQEQQLRQEQKPLPPQEHEQQHQEQEMLQEQEQQLPQEQKPPPPQEHKQQQQEQEMPQEQEQQLQQEQKLPQQQEHEQQQQQEQEQHLQQEQQQHQGQEMPQEQEQQLQHEQQQPQQEPPLQQEQEQQQQQQQQLLQESSPSASGARSRRGKRKRSAPVEQGNASVPAHPLPQPSTPGQVPQAATHAAPQQQAEAEQPGLLERITAIVQACDTPAAAASGVDGPLLSSFLRFWVQQADDEERRHQVAALDVCVQSGSFTSVGALLKYILRNL
ncbi:hypothetical protein D9Q98_009609 [Chlorella vulgaris]|uniref:Uncharacterized protein n=1 Tax=Chlorella vulgaris TaxID=3077 RepID=A0A9D4YST9_CHLVU|nr:hypothetical protein D9Q98_009609 [Chlorella vulgaris]